MTRILEQADKVGLSNTEEFTFRSFFMAAAHGLLESPRFQTEWHRFDLLVQAGETATLIEFKYYLRRRTIGLDGTPEGWKGGAGLQNEREFFACLDKLGTTAIDGIHKRRLVLVYERDELDAQRGTKTPHHNYGSSYGSLKQSPKVEQVWSLTNGPLEARILQPADTVGHVRED